MSWFVLMLTTFLVPGEAPRYRLEPGMELLYTATSSTPANPEKKQAASETQTKWQIHVLNRNSDGSFRVVILSESGKAPNIRWDARQVNLFPDGRTIQESEPANSFGTILLPPLPREQEEQWNQVIARDNASCQFKRTSSEKGLFQFHEDRQGGMLTIYDAASSFDYTFDPAQGVITSITGSRKKIDDPDHLPYKHGGSFQTTFKVELTSKTVRSADWTAGFIKEVDTYFALKEEAPKRYLKATKSGEVECQKLMESMNTQWTEAKSGIKHPGLIALVEDALKNGKNYVRWATDDAKRRVKLIGEPVPAWAAKDFEGQSYSHESLRGKVVVLDFWYRGCGWCIRAMPQMNQLAADLKNEPVVILGVNIDEDPEDARFVMKRMKLSYPNLEFNKVMEKDKPHPLIGLTFGYPTLLIIDKEGKLADIHVGYSPTLRQEVTESIRKVLAKK